MKKFCNLMCLLLASSATLANGPFNGTGTGSQPVYTTAASGFGQCINFTSNGTITVNPDSSSGGPFTVGFRFNSTSAFSTVVSLAGAGNADGIAVEGGEVIFNWSSFQGFTTSTGGSYNDGTWHTVEMDGKPSTGDVYCFVDGVLVHHDTNLNNAANEHLTTIGNNGLTCKVDEVFWMNSTCLHTSSYTPGTIPISGVLAGLDALYHLDGNLNDSTGIGLVAGTPNAVVRGTTTYNLSATAATGNTGTVNYQWQRAPDSGGSPGTYTNVGSSSTSLTFADSGLNPGTKYWYRIAATDSLTTATSAGISVATKVSGEVPCVCIGDSITFGYQNTVPSVQNPVFHLTNILTSAGIQGNNGGAMRIFECQNSGITGTKSADWQPGGENYNAAVVAGDLLGATVYSIMLGANDAFASVSSGGFTTNMTNIVNGLTARGYTVVLQSCYYISGETALIPQYNNDLQTLVDNVHVFAGDTTAYALWQTNFGAFTPGGPGSWYQSDNLHPSPLGADILGGLWMRSIGQAVGISLGGSGSRIIG